MQKGLQRRIVYIDSLKLFMGEMTPFMNPGVFRTFVVVRNAQDSIR